MALTPDRSNGPSLEEEIRLEDNGVGPAVDGSVMYNSGSFMLQDSVGVFNPRNGTTSPDGLCFALLTTEGGVVYTTNGEPTLKVVA